MRTFVLRAGFLFTPVAFAGWMGWGCSSSSDTPAETPDAAADSPAPPTAPPPPPPDDSGSDAGICATDTQADGLQKHLACTGLYSDFPSKTVAAGVVQYKPAQEFWSDGAVKTRWLRLPPGSKIDISNFDEWTWPKGTTVWKEFKVFGKRVETRIFTKLADGNWNRTTYLWNDDETDAVRNEQGKKVANPDGGPSYEVPSTGYCDECHKGKVEPLLGLEAVQLGISGAEGVTLASLAQDGWLSAPPPATSLTIPDDPGLTGANAGKAVLALRWLHANCGTCHAPLQTAGAFFTNAHFQIRASQLLPDAGDGGGAPTARNLDAYTTSVCKTATRPKDGGQWVVIQDQSPAESLASVLSGERAPEGQAPTTLTQMPPIISHVVDEVGHQQLVDWINAMPACPYP